jgi:hypothetical protein
MKYDLFEIYQNSEKKKNCKKYNNYKIKKV